MKWTGLLCILCAVSLNIGAFGAVVKRSSDDGDGGDDSLGKFWHVTDFHYDSKYSQSGIALQMCHADWLKKETLGKFGDYKCDAPWLLVESAIAAMKQLEPNPDFIFWTGDSVPHVEVSQLSEKENVDMIGQITDHLYEVFNKTTIFPSFGNHDPYPVNQMPFSSDKFFEDVLTTSGWNKLLKDEAATTFKTAGYYSTLLNAQVKVISLNTAIYYDLNKLVGNSSDPGGQIAWLQNELKLSRSRKEKAFIVGHVPPGVFGRVKNINWISDTFNKQLISVSQQYSDVIIAHIYGHEHTDGFRVLKDAKGVPISPILMAPAVTPWNSTLVGAGYNNPGIRLFTYNRYTGQLLDYSQYYLDLPEANKAGKATWKLEYALLKDYGLKNMSAVSLYALAQSFKTNASTQFAQYFKFNAVSSSTEACDDACKKLHVCAITEVDISAYQTCVTPKELGEKTTAEETQKNEKAEDKGKTEKNEKAEDKGKNQKNEKAKDQSKDPEVKTKVRDVLLADSLDEALVFVTKRDETVEGNNRTKSLSTTSTSGYHGDTTRHPHFKPMPRYMFWIIFGMAILVVILFVMVFLLCWRQRQLHLRLNNPRYMRANTGTLTSKLLTGSSRSVQYT